MKCPYCKKNIDAKLLAQELGRAGGSKSRRTLTKEQAQEMQRAKTLNQRAIKLAREA
jgi:hypothetical protein